LKYNKKKRNIENVRKQIELRKKEIEALITILELYMNKKIYKEERKEFKNIFFKNVFSMHRTINAIRRGIGCINSILKEDKIPFQLVSARNRKIPHRGETYWILTKT